MSEQLTLGELIAALENADQDLILPDGFDEPHSYRGVYAELAFEPARDVTVAAMLASAYDALDNTYEGYKGGHFTMTRDTWCHIAVYGCCGDEDGLTRERLHTMLAAGRKPESVADRAADLMASTMDEVESIGRAVPEPLSDEQRARTAADLMASLRGQAVAEILDRRWDGIAYAAHRRHRPHRNSECRVCRADVHAIADAAMSVAAPMVEEFVQARAEVVRLRDEVTAVDAVITAADVDRAGIVRERDALRGEVLRLRGQLAMHLTAWRNARRRATTRTARMDYWRGRAKTSAAAAEQLQSELARVRREAHRDRLAADGAIARIEQLTGERDQAEADVDRLQNLLKDKETSQ